MTISKHDFKLNLDRAYIAVNVRNEAKHDYVYTNSSSIQAKQTLLSMCKMWPNITTSTFVCKFNSHKADIDVNLPIVVKQDYVIKRIQATFK